MTYEQGCVATVGFISTWVWVEIGWPKAKILKWPLYIEVSLKIIFSLVFIIFLF